MNCVTAGAVKEKGIQRYTKACVEMGICDGRKKKKQEDRA